MIGQVLEGLADDRYEFDDDGEGEVVTVKNYGATLEEMEEFFGKQLDAINDTLIDMEADIAEIDDADYDLPAQYPVGEDSWNDWCTEQLLLTFMDSDGAALILKRLKGLDYGQVSSRLYWGLTNLLQREAKTVVHGRKRLTTSEVKEVEARMLARPQQAAANMIASEYARQLGRRFPRMVNRAEQLRVLVADEQVHADVQTYLRHATECYVYGQFIACLLLCRSAVEFGLRGFLEKRGRQAELECLKKEGRDTLGGLITLAQQHFAAKKPTLDSARTLNHKATEAVHERAPDVDTCKEMFDVTRVILRELYS